MKTNPTQKTWRLTWAPSWTFIATVQARTQSEARRKAPKPYRKFLGEIDAEEVQADENKD